MKTIIIMIALLATPADGDDTLKENLPESLNRILEHEGLFSNDPKDNGGMTMRGVTQAVYENWVDRPVTEAEMKALTVGDVAPIYKKEYWDRIKGDDLSPGLDLLLFDMAVNSGTSRASRILQQVVGTKVDGGIGPVTLAAVARMDPVDIIHEYSARREAFYKRLAQPRFEKGWLRRNEKTQIAALRMAEAG